MEFRPAKLDTMATAITIFTTVFLVAFAIFFPTRTVPYGWIFSLLMISIVVFSYLLSPKRYYIQGGNFVIEKVVGKKFIIPLNEIEGIIEIEDFNKLKPIRSMGNGGLFGYYGIFTTKDYGNINCQLTRLKKIILLKSKKGYFAISPAHPEMMSEYLHSITGFSGITRVESAEIRERKKASFLILVIPDTIFTLVIIMAVLLYQQLPERIATHFDFYGNPDGYSHKSAFLITTILPQLVLFVINIVVFFTMRNRYQDNRAVYLLIIIISLIQIFVGFTSFDIYYFNMYNRHIIPLFWGIISISVLIGLLLIIYNKFLTKNS